MKRKKMKFSPWIWYALLSVFLIVGCSHNKGDEKGQKKAPSSQLTVLMDAYEYGYPLILMDLTREHSLNADNTIGPKVPMNHFSHSTKFPDDKFKAVIRPNVDTLYSQAWLDLTDGAQIVEVPDTKGRYYLMPMLDAWSNVYFSPGSRTTGTGSRKFLIVGPNWKGETPAGMLLVKSPTNLTWIICRIQANNNADIKNVARIQKGFKISPLHKMDKPQSVASTGESAALPIDRIGHMSTEEFFNRLNTLMVQNPPGAEDNTILEKFAKIGIAPGATFSLDKLPPQDREKAALLSYNMEKKFSAEKMNLTTPVNGWMTLRNLGRYGSNYNLRAMIAYTGFGANLDVDALYPIAFTDGDGNKLSGEKSYLIHFPKGGLPPVNAFWSLTIYTKDGFLFKNSINRFALGSNNNLKYNIDGSLDIFMSQNRPSKDWQSNWLPIPKEEFNLTARLYWPQEKALDPKWSLPEIRPTTGKEISSRD